MIVSLPHPTEVGLHARYDIDTVPAILARWADEYGNDLADEPTQRLRHGLWALFHGLHGSMPAERVADELKRLYDQYEASIYDDAEVFALTADQWWDEAELRAGKRAA